MAKQAQDSVVLRKGKERSKELLWTAGVLFVFAAGGWWLVLHGNEPRVKGWLVLLGFTGAVPIVLGQAIRGVIWPEREAAVQKLSACGPSAVKEVDAILTGSIPHTKFGALRYDKNWIVYQLGPSVVTFSTSDVAWVYALNSTVRIYNTKGELITQDAEVGEIDRRIAELVAVCPNALYGYHDGLQRRFMSKPGEIAKKMNLRAKLGQRNAAEFDPKLQILG
jgi:hypothetical protein